MLTSRRFLFLLIHWFQRTRDIKCLKMTRVSKISPKSSRFLVSCAKCLCNWSLRVWNIIQRAWDSEITSHIWCHWSIPIGYKEITRWCYNTAMLTSSECWRAVSDLTWSSIFKEITTIRFLTVCIWCCHPIINCFLIYCR
jgi:hypothetical protein